MNNKFPNGRTEAPETLESKWKVAGWATSGCTIDLFIWIGKGISGMGREWQWQVKDAAAWRAGLWWRAANEK